MDLSQFLAHNLYGFDPGLEGQSRQAIITNLVISLVPYLYGSVTFFAQLLGKIGNFMAMSSLAAGVGGLFWLETNIQLSRSLLEKLNMMSFIEN